MGAPGCPLLACCTASIAKVRIVLMHSVSSCLPVTTACSLATMRRALLPGTTWRRFALLHWLVLLEFRGRQRVSVTPRVYQFPWEPCQAICEKRRELAQKAREVGS